MKKLVIASNNNGKIKEIKEILKDLKINVFSLKDMNIDIDVEEDGDTFAANAKKKAVEIAKVLNKANDKEFFVLSDDSGLCVDYLNGEPGVYSARYAGEHGDDKANNKKLLESLSGIERNKRSGRFVCSMALVDSNLNCRIVEGTVSGIILEKESGEGGFGYDPLFFNEQIEKSFGEATAEEKNKISHRAIALNKLKELLWEIL